MKKIINWTFGSVFRTLGRVLTYLALGGLIAFICVKNDIKITQLFGIETIKAAEITPLEVKKFYVADVTDNIINPDQQWSNAIDWGTEYNRTSETSLFLRSIRVRAGYSSKFLKGITYKFKVNVIFSNSTNGYFYKLPESIICQGSGTSSWSSDTDLISSCKFVGREFYNNKANASYIFEFVPSADIYGVQIAWYYKLPVYGNYDMYFANLGKIRVLNSSKITYNNSTNEAINSMSDSITINQDKNTENIINNNNQNTQEIIDSQNQLLGSKCSNLYTGNIHTANNGKKALDLTNLENGKTYTLSSVNNVYVAKFSQTDQNATGNIVGPEFWDSSGKKTWTFTYTGNKYLYIDITSSAGEHFVNNENDIKQNKFMIVEGINSKSYCEYGSYQSKLDDTNNALNDLNSSINDDDTTGAKNEASSFFNSFSTNNHGLTGIITAPLNAIQSLTSQTCSSLVLPLPFVNQNLTLPCMRPIYNQWFGNFMTLYDLITLGIVSYWIMVRIFALVKDFKNPEHDEIEVMEL